MDEQENSVDTMVKFDVSEMPSTSSESEVSVGSEVTENTKETPLDDMGTQSNASTTIVQSVVETEPKQTSSMPTDDTAAEAEPSNQQTFPHGMKEHAEDKCATLSIDVLSKLQDVADAVQTLDGHLASLESTLLESLKNVGQTLMGLRESFEARLRYDSMKDEAISRLNKELDGFRRGAIAKDVSSLVDNIILEIDGTRRIAKRFDGMEPNEKNFKKVISELMDGAEALEDSVLSRVGVRRYQSSAFVRFDVDRHALVKDAYIDTSDFSKDNQIESSVRCGYERIVPTVDGGTRSVVVRPEQVTVYRFVASPQPDGVDAEQRVDMVTDTLSETE